MLATTSVQNFFMCGNTEFMIINCTLASCLCVKLGLSHWEKPGADENICTHQMLLERLGARGMWKNWMGEFHLNLRSDNLKEKDHFEDLVAGDRIILKCIFKEQG